MGSVPNIGLCFSINVYMGAVYVCCLDDLNKGINFPSLVV